jgi:hypothetical protein
MRCFNSLRSLLLSYEFRKKMPKVHLGGFPHSEISGSQAICASPKLIAAYHVLHRRQMPRHPPCALVHFQVTFSSIKEGHKTKKTCVSLTSFPKELALFFRVPLHPTLGAKSPSLLQCVSIQLKVLLMLVSHKEIYGLPEKELPSRLGDGFDCSLRVR